MTLQLVDQNGQPLHSSQPARWYGVCEVAILKGDARWDGNGQVAVPARQAWASLYYRLRADSGSLHKLNGTYAELDFHLPAGYAIDLKAMGLATQATETS